MQGAERLLQWDEISRFRELPIVISFTAQTDGKTETMTRVLEVEELDKEGDAAVWRLADVKGNSPGLDLFCHRACRNGGCLLKQTTRPITRALIPFQSSCFFTGSILAWAGCPSHVLLLRVPSCLFA